MNTVRVHWLVDELEAIGLREIIAAEYFTPLSQISRLALLREDNLVEDARRIVHKVGTTGTYPHHLFEVSDFSITELSDLPLGSRIGRFHG